MARPRKPPREFTTDEALKKLFPPEVRREALRKPLRGLAVEAGDGMLHIEGDTGTTLCGEPVESYPLHWDTRTVIACGICLMEAGVPLSTTPDRSPNRPDGDGKPPHADGGDGEEGHAAPTADGRAEA